MTLSYVVDWLIKGELIFLSISGDVAIEDVEPINARLVELLRAGEPPVHILADLKELGKFPFDLISVRRIATWLEEPNLGLVTAYGTSRLASSFTQLLMSLAGVKVRFVRDYVHAINVLAAEDARIKALLDAGELPVIN